MGHGPPPAQEPVPTRSNTICWTAPEPARPESNRHTGSNLSRHCAAGSCGWSYVDSVEEDGEAEGVDEPAETAVAVTVLGEELAQLGTIGLAYRKNSAHIPTSSAAICLGGTPNWT